MSEGQGGQVGRWWAWVAPSRARAVHKVCACVVHFLAAPPLLVPTWKFMCSLCCVGVWRVRKRRIMRSSLRFSSPSVRGKGGKENNHQ